MMKSAASLAIAAIFLFFVTSLGGQVVKTPFYCSAENSGQFEIFASHALMMDAVLVQQGGEPFTDVDWDDDEDWNWVYGMVGSFPVTKSVALGAWVYGPFWSIWPAVLKPTALELNSRIVFWREGKHCMAVTPAFLAAYMSSDYDGWKGKYFDAEKTRTYGIHVPVTYTYKMQPNLNHNLTASLNCDWVNLEGNLENSTTYDYVKLDPKTIFNGAVTYNAQMQMQAFYIRAEAGLSGYEGYKGKFKVQFIYGLGFGTTW